MAKGKTHEEAHEEAEKQKPLTTDERLAALEAKVDRLCRHINLPEPQKG